MPHLHSRLNSPASAHLALGPSFVFFTLRIAFPTSSLFSQRSGSPPVFSNYPVTSVPLQRPLPYFQQLTNPSRSAIDKHLLYSHHVTNPSSRNSFVFSSIQIPRVSPLHPHSPKPLRAERYDGPLPCSAKSNLALAVHKCATYNSPLKPIHCSGSYDGQGQEE